MNIKDKQIKTRETDAASDETYYSRELECTAVQLSTNFSQGSAGMDLNEGGNFNASFIRRSFLTLTMIFFDNGLLQPKL